MLKDETLEMLQKNYNIIKLTAKTIEEAEKEIHKHLSDTNNIFYEIKYDNGIAIDADFLGSGALVFESKHINKDALKKMNSEILYKVNNLFEKSLQLEIPYVYFNKEKEILYFFAQYVENK